MTFSLYLGLWMITWATFFFLITNLLNHIWYLSLFLGLGFDACLEFSYFRVVSHWCWALATDNKAIILTCFLVNMINWLSRPLLQKTIMMLTCIPVVSLQILWIFMWWFLTLYVVLYVGVLSFNKKYSPVGFWGETCGCQVLLRWVANK